MACLASVDWQETLRNGTSLAFDEIELEHKARRRAQSMNLVDTCDAFLGASSCHTFFLLLKLMCLAWLAIHNT